MNVRRVLKSSDTAEIFLLFSSGLYFFWFLSLSRRLSPHHPRSFFLRRRACLTC